MLISFLDRFLSTHSNQSSHPKTLNPRTAADAISVCVCVHQRQQVRDVLHEVLSVYGLLP